MMRLPVKVVLMDRTAGAAMAAWLGVQVLALGIGAGRVMLWARSPAAGEQLSLFIMMCVQIGAASLLFPLLLRDWRITLIALATAWPFAELAGFLADAGRNQWVAGELYVSVWLVSLYLWGRALGNSWRVLGAAMAGMISLGGPMLWYLRSEFAGSGQMEVGSIGVFGPIMGAFSLILPAPGIKAWIMIGMLLLAGAAARVARRVQESCRDDKLST